MGPQFQITRSVRQGCPLAPFLYLIFAEALHIFLNAQVVGIRRLFIPLSDQQLIDAELADDTALYVEGSQSNLIVVQDAITTFCKGAGAMMNWHKSVAFWVDSEMTEHPSWQPHEDFKWVPRGTPVRYLGCQVGIDLSPEQQIAPLLLSIRKKIAFWSTAKLSLAGRVVVVNNVLLSTIWYIASSWMFAKSTMDQIKRLVRNFLWSGKDVVTC